MQSYKHKSSTRPLIPSKEEAGMEESAIQNRKDHTDLPLNPVTKRGEDPELYWMHKYGADDKADTLEVDSRSLYRHEHISPELLIRKLYRQVQDAPKQGDQLNLFAPDVREIFGNTLDMDEMEKVGEYYKHQGEWSNRLIQGDSLLTMTSLLEREGFAGKVQTIYFDPPYGIKYGSNWQLKLHDRDVKDGSDEHLSSEPEQIKAFRDTWELGIHSYLTYMRDRLLVARELMTESGSCFVQISDENVHLVRCLMDEVFGSGNFVSLITFKTTSGFESTTLGRQGDYLLWYSKDASIVKFRPLYFEQPIVPGERNAKWILLPDGSYRGVTTEEKEGTKPLPNGARLYKPDNIVSQGAANIPQPFEYLGKNYFPPSNSHWKANYPNGMNRLAKKGRLHVAKNSIQYIRFADDFPFQRQGNFWMDTAMGSFTDDKVYVVQTNAKIIERCLLMTTDPGDLVLDPTCGSGTTAYVAEQWGRRWITLDTSRIALNIAKTRLMTAVFPYYHLYSDVDVTTSEKNGKIKKDISPKKLTTTDINHSSLTINHAQSDIRQGFVYEEVPHITLKSLANDEPPSTETLYDKPHEDKTRLRVAGPFTVETLQNYEPGTVDDIQKAADGTGIAASASGTFEERVFEHLKVTGVMNGAKEERAVFTRIERIGSPHLHAEGYYNTDAGERKAYLHIGPQFGTVSKQSVNEAVKECRSRGDADWLIVLGFSFESDIANQNVTLKVGSFEVSKVRMHDDLLQEGLTKKDKKAASFVTIGEPDVVLIDSETVTAEGQKTVQVEIQGLDIYDPIRDKTIARHLADIAYWMLDDDYDGSNFIVKQVFFCGGDKDEFNKWKRGLSDLVKQQTKKKAERTLRLELDEEAWDALYGFRSHPIVARKGRKIAVRVVSQFGEESMKVLFG
jgi:adenine-specific DNA-methyltransferase